MYYSHLKFKIQRVYSLLRPISPSLSLKFCIIILAMFPNLLLRPFKDNSRKNKVYDDHLMYCDNMNEPAELHRTFAVPFNRDHHHVTKLPIKYSLRSEFQIPPKKSSNGSIKKMATKVSNFSDLIQRVTASCLLHPLSATRHASDVSNRPDSGTDSDEDNYITEEEEEEEEKGEEEEDLKNWEGKSKSERTELSVGRVMQMEMLLGEVFEAVSAMKRAYVSLQDAHCPWDPDRMRVADVAVVAELRRLGVLKERFRRSVGGGGRGRRKVVAAATLREVVAPYEAAVDELKRDLKAKEVEIDNLKEKLQTAASLSGTSSGGKKGKSKKKVSCISQVVVAPAPELFEATMSSVKEAAKAFTAMLLSLMRSAHWDIAAAVRSIEAASSTATNAAATFTDSIVGANHAKYALESYVNRKMFQGFDHETFYMDGSLSSLLRPDQHRRDCFTQYRDMKTMDPVELLGILPTCSFGNFCFKKYLAIVHPKMEESLFGDLEQRRQVLANSHPRSQFYGEFLRLAKAIWMLHLLAFSMDPPPSHFEASRGAEFHPQYMESVVRIPVLGGGSRMGVVVPQVVGFPVTPGFKLGNSSIIKARVYLVPKNGF